MVNRRELLKFAAALASPCLPGAASDQTITITDCTIVISPSPGTRESAAVSMLIEEAENRSGIRWKVRTAPAQVGAVTIYAGTGVSWKRLGPRVSFPAASIASLDPEGYAIRTGMDAQGRWITVTGADERG